MPSKFSVSKLLKGSKGTTAAAAAEDEGHKEEAKAISSSAPKAQPTTNPPTSSPPPPKHQNQQESKMKYQDNHSSVLVPKSAARVDPEPETEIEQPHAVPVAASAAAGETNVDKDEVEYAYAAAGPAAPAGSLATSGVDEDDDDDDDELYEAGPAGLVDDMSAMGLDPGTDGQGAKKKKKKKRGKRGKDKPKQKPEAAPANPPTSPLSEELLIENAGPSKRNATLSLDVPAGWKKSEAGKVAMTLQEMDKKIHHTKLLHESHGIKIGEDPTPTPLHHQRRDDYKRWKNRGAIVESIDDRLAELQRLKAVNEALIRREVARMNDEAALDAKYEPKFREIRERHYAKVAKEREEREKKEKEQEGGVEEEPGAAQGGRVRAGRANSTSSGSSTHTVRPTKGGLRATTPEPATPDNET